MKVWAGCRKIVSENLYAGLWTALEHYCPRSEGKDRVIGVQWETGREKGWGQKERKMMEELVR